MSINASLPPLGNTASEQLKEDCLRRRDYDTISVGVLDDHFAALALANKGKIFARNRAIVDKNRAILDAWVQATPEVYYQKPQAGTTALVY